jgi:WD40 repeat protein
MGEVFISHASADKEAAVFIATVLRQSGHNVFLDSDRRDGISPGNAWRQTLFRKVRACDSLVFLNSESSQASMWCHTELAVAGELNKRTYSLDLSPTISPHPLLSDLQGIRLQTTVEESSERLIDSLRRDGLAGWSAAWDDRRPPYPGLAAMDVEDAGVYFGRDGDVEKLIERVGGQVGQIGGDLVVVMGSSGAGKSSLVRAGLAARLSSLNSGWLVVEPFEPGVRPLDRLVNRLIAITPNQMPESDCRARLSTNGLAAFADWVVDRTEPRAKRLLITVDQCEQLATLTPPTERNEFLRLLGESLEPGSPVTVVTTVRSDRFEEAQRLPILGPMIHEPFVVVRMDRAQLAVIIEGPAARADLRINASLVGRLIDDAMQGSIGEAVDALPLLAFTLREMYDLVVTQGRRVITEADYENVGRIEGAISRRAQVAEHSLPPRSEVVLERLLPRFVTLGEDRQPVGRPVLRKQLTQQEQEIVATLENQRLLTGANDTIRLAHEALITSWPTLAHVVADHRDDLLLQARLERQANDWKSDAGTLLSKEAAGDASHWLSHRADPAVTSPVVSEYISASGAALRRRRRAVIGSMSLIVALALLASGFAVYAGHRNAELRSESHVAQSRELAAEAVAVLPNDARLGSLLSAESYALAPTAEAHNAIVDALEQPLEMTLNDGSRISSIAFSPNGKLLATGDASGQLVLWNTANGSHAYPPTHTGSALNTVAFSPDGSMFATGDAAGAVIVRRTRDRSEAFPPLHDGSSVSAVAFSPDGSLLATGDAAGNVFILSATSGVMLAPKIIDGSAIDTLAFNPVGSLLAIGDTAGSISIRSSTTGLMIVPTITEGSAVNTAAFNPAGSLLATGNALGYIDLLNVSDGRMSSQPLSDGSSVNGLLFRSGGDTIVTGDAAGGIVQWNLDTQQRIGPTLGDGSSVNSIAFTDSTIAAGSDSGDVVMWNIAPRRETLNQASSPSPQDKIDTVAFGREGDTLATGGYAGNVELWSLSDKVWRAQLTGDGHQILSVALSANGKEVAAGDTQGNIMIWRTSDKTMVRQFSADRSQVDSVTFNPDGNVLATGNGGATITLWDIRTGRKLRLPLHAPDRKPVRTVAFSPNGKLIAAGDDGGEISLWNTSDGMLSGKPLFNLDRKTIRTVAFSPDGNVLAAGDDGGEISLWSTTRRNQIGQPLDDGSAVYSIAFSSDGKTLTSGDAVGNIVPWDPTTGGRIGEPLVDGTADYSIALSPNGDTLAVGDDSNSPAVFPALPWTGTTATFTQRLCNEVRGNLSGAEWTRYVPSVTYRKICSDF